jgi:alpha-ribazole phosphatase
MADRIIDLLRHGEVQGGGRFRGSHDDPLAPAGWAQMHAAVAADAAAGRATWDCILHSPAVRCADFARALAEQRDLPTAALPDLRERGFGAWEGLRADQIPLGDLSRFWADPMGYDPPDAEPFAAFRERVRRGWQALLAGHAAQPLIVTHGGVVRLCIGEVLGLAAERLLLLEVPPACRTRFRVPLGGGRPSLISHGAC